MRGRDEPPADRIRRSMNPASICGTSNPSSGIPGARTRASMGRPPSSTVAGPSRFRTSRRTLSPGRICSGPTQRMAGRREAGLSRARRRDPDPAAASKPLAAPAKKTPWIGDVDLRASMPPGPRSSAVSTSLISPDHLALAPTVIEERPNTYPSGSRARISTFAAAAPRLVRASPPAPMPSAAPVT